MSEVPDSHELARQIVALEEPMNTVQAECRTDIARLAEDAANRDSRRAVSDFTARVWMIALTLAGLAASTTILGVLISHS